MFLRLTGISINLNQVITINTSGSVWIFVFGNGGQKDQVILTPEEQTELEATYQFDDETGQFVFKTPVRKAGKTDWVR